MLQSLLKKLIAKHQPEVIVIMNDINHATMKEAVTTVLKHKYAVKGRLLSFKKGELENFLLGTKNASFFTKYRRAKDLLKGQTYPKLFVLEGGYMDTGTLKKLLGFGVKLKLVIIDDLVDSNGAAFLASSVAPDGYLLLNADKKVLSMKRKTRAHVITYGFSDKADIQAQEVKIQQTLRDEMVHIEGMTFKMKYKGNFIPVTIGEVLGNEAVYTALAAMSAGIAHGLNALDISNSLKTFHPAGGRMRILPGIKHTTLIDDTFACDYDSVLEALTLMSELQPKEGKKKIAVISEVKGLGNKSAVMHKQIGEQVAKSGFDYFIAVGHQAKIMGQGAVEEGMNETQVYIKEDEPEAGRFLQDLMKKGDLIFIDGNEEEKSEMMVKEVMAEPLKANMVLARSYEEWKM